MKISFSFALCCVCFLLARPSVAKAQAKQPNIIFILADDLGYGDLGCYGQKIIKTPRIDRMAAEGMRFTDFYAGCTVCAPSRSVLMTGQHMGHTHVRGNAGGANMAKQSLRDEDVTVAEVLKEAGYATALCGKWGLGDDGPGGRTGLPRRQGFDSFYGYLNQKHAHNYYPEFLWRNETKHKLRNEVQKSNSKYGGFTGGWATKRIDYSHDLVAAEAIKFIREKAKPAAKADGCEPTQQAATAPFFLYLSLTIPHANNEGTRGTGDGQEVPTYGIYQDEDWPKQDKGQAAMITRMDTDVGRILDLLEDLDIAENTLVMFSSDNGHHNEGGHNTKRFDPNGPLRGMKRDLYEGGIRVPFIAWWPNQIKPDTTSNHIGYFGDLMATAADLAGAKCPKNTDSVSFVPTLMGKTDEQKKHKSLYWEFYERGGKQAVRVDNWKAVRMPMKSGKTELYNLSVDIGEERNLAADNPQIVKRMEAMMDTEHVDHPNWQVRGKPAKKK